MSRITTIRSFAIRMMPVVAVALLLVGCSSSSDESNDANGDGAAPALDVPPPGQAADVSPNPLRRQQPGDPPEHPETEPFDPIEVNGEIFEGWSGKPKVAFVVTGRMDGYIEPCGCAGLDRMMGGMTRRHTFLRQLREDRGWTVVAMDVGGLAKGFGSQAASKYQTTLNGMRTMGYGAINLGMSELRLPVGDVVAEVTADDKQNPFFSANVGLWGPPGELTPRLRIIPAGGIKIGVTGVLGKSYQKEIQGDEIQLSDPQAAIKEVLPGLKQQADFLVLLAHASVDESKALAKAFPEFQLVVTAGGPDAPPEKPELLAGGRTHFIEVGKKGMYAVVLAMFPDDPEPFRYQRVPLDSRFPASAEMKGLMDTYQSALQDAGFAKLGIPLGDRAPAHPQAELTGQFTGSKKCGVCHEEAYRQWKKSGHAKAFRTLQEADPPRIHDPECISCHVVGWHPAQYFPYRGSYESLETTPSLIDVGCESCHGPGSAHEAAENGSDTALQKKLAQAMVITVEEAQDHASGKQFCRSCHDLDNSPAFDFETYWLKIIHSEEDD